jgi:hypothetical protein
MHQNSRGQGVDDSRQRTTSPCSVICAPRRHEARPRQRLTCDALTIQHCGTSLTLSASSKRLPQILASAIRCATGYFAAFCVLR